MQNFLYPEISPYLEKNNLEVIDSNETKPWGAYYILNSSPEFDTKILLVKPHNALSLQFHGTPEHPGHNEEWTAITPFRIVLSKETAVGKSPEQISEIIKNLQVISLQPGEQIKIPAGFMHALVNPFADKNIMLRETRTSQVAEASAAREENIVRVFDQTHRDNLPDFPADLKAKMFAV